MYRVLRLANLLLVWLASVDPALAGAAGTSWEEAPTSVVAQPEIYQLSL